MLSIAWPIIAQMTSMQIHFQTAHIGTIGMDICKAMMVRLKLEINIRVPFTKMVHCTAGVETTTGNSEMEESMVASLHLSL